MAPSNDYRIDDVLGGLKWDSNHLTFSFYAGGGYYGFETSPTQVSDAVKANVRFILNQVIAPLINVTFTEVTDSPTSYGDIRYLCSPDAGYAYASYPDGTDVGGDVVLDPSSDIASTFDTNSFRLGPGSHGFQAIIHETCHALGLKHPGDYNGNGTGDPPYLPLGEDNGDNTLMSYNFDSGFEPATPMTYDVLALQYMYGPNTSTRASDTTYAFTAVDAFSPGSGSSGAPTTAFDRRKNSLWDGGGIDTIDLTGLPSVAGGYRIDVQPGGWITTNSAYRTVRYDATTGSPTQFSPGTTYAATNYGTRIPLSGTSIENIVESRASDTMYLNSATNVVSGYAPGVASGADVIFNSDASDTLDLTQFLRTSVVESQSGNDLVVNLGAAGSVTVNNYYGVATTSRINVRYQADTSTRITSDRATLKAGDTATITFTLGMDATNFTLGDVGVTGGSLANFTGAGTSYTATFTPTPNFAGTASITVAAGTYTDRYGTPNAAGLLQLTVDTIAPTLTITRTGNGTLKIGNTDTITFTLSESSTNFVVGDVAVIGGTLSNFAGTGNLYTATFTPAADLLGTATIAVAGAAFTDAAGNPNVAAGPLPIPVDTVAPTVTITRNGTGTLTIGRNTTITFTLSEAAADFTSVDVAVAGGTISNFAGFGTVYTATFAPAVAFTGTATVTVAASAFTGANGNPNKVAALGIAVDTVPPAVTITRSGSGTIKIGDTPTITFALNEASTDFTVGDVAVTGGTLSNFAGSGTSYTATFTPDATFAGTATVTVAIGAFADPAGNANATAGYLPIAVDTVAPTVTITWSGSGAIPIGDTPTITFTLSETSTDFAASDVSVSGGTLSDFAGSGDSYTATFTPDAASLGTATFSVPVGTFTDPAGNANAVPGYLSIANAPRVIGFSSQVTSAILHIGDSILIVAEFSEPIVTAGSMTVQLNSGAVLQLMVDPDGLAARGLYTVQPGEVAADLDVVAIVSFDSLTNAAGEPLASTLPTTGNDLAARCDIVVDGAVTLLDPSNGFSTYPTLIRDLGSIQRIPLSFTTPVSGVTVGSFRLRINGTAWPLQGARLDGAGQSYTLLLPVSRIRPFGIYKLEITPGATIRATANGALVSGAKSLFWGNHRSVGMLPDAPSGLVAQRVAPVRGKIAVALTWQAAAGNGGGPATEYLVDYRVAGTSTWRRVRTTLATPGTSIQGLVVGRNYEFRVAAKNSAGIGEYAVSSLFLG